MVGDKTDLLKYYWRKVFPALIDFNSLQDWQASYARINEQIKSQDFLPAEAITLRKPAESAHPADIKTWIDLFGEEAQTGSLATIVIASQRTYIRSLLHYCVVEEVRLPPEADDESDADERIDVPAPQ